MFWTLVKKDLLRVKRTPGVYLLQLALPIMITALVGFAFGPKGDSSQFPKIKVGFVDEDDEFLSEFILGSLGQDEFQKYLDVQKLTREEANRKIEENELSAIICIPKNFTKDFLEQKNPQEIELFKNPAERYLPKIVEEGMLILGELLNAISRNLGEEIPLIKKLIEAQSFPKPKEWTEMVDRVTTKLEASEKYLFPILINFETIKEKEKKKSKESNVFVLLLPGISALFLFFIGELSVRDILREGQLKTLDRIRTIRYGLFPFVLSKIFCCMIVLFISGIILFGGSTFIFKIQWKSITQISILLLSFSFIAAGLIALLISFARTEQQANVINSTVIMMMGFLGGSMIPASELPQFIQDNISIYLPNYWFIQSVLQQQNSTVSFQEWLQVPLGFVGVGFLFILLSSFLLQQKLNRGVR